jgi:hypothetical protein
MSGLEVWEAANPQTGSGFVRRLDAIEPSGTSHLYWEERANDVDGTACGAVFSVSSPTTTSFLVSHVKITTRTYSRLGVRRCSSHVWLCLQRDGRHAHLLLLRLVRRDALAAAAPPTATSTAATANTARAAAVTAFATAATVAALAAATDGSFTGLATSGTQRWATTAFASISGPAFAASNGR